MKKHNNRQIIICYYADSNMVYYYFGKLFCNQEFQVVPVSKWKTEMIWILAELDDYWIRMFG